uniref:Uncharacterized protein MANES_09G019100 n=1 Tax=Rhizophora mucronata TaxID=61149 RepID=A0A2P2JC57_RHIMU
MQAKLKQCFVCWCSQNFIHPIFILTNFTTSVPKHNL